MMDLETFLHQTTKYHSECSHTPIQWVALISKDLEEVDEINTVYCTSG